MMMANYLLGAWCGIIFLFPTMMAETRSPSDPMNIFVDYARFRGSDTTLYVELYYSFSPGSLTYSSDDDGLRGGVDLNLSVRMRDSVVFSDRWIMPHTLTDTTREGLSVSLVSVSALELGEGDYQALIVGRDQNNPGRIDSVRIQIPIRMIGSHDVVISDIELATKIVQGSEGSPFYKNTLEVVPSPQGIFGEQQLCYAYAEVYNLLTGIPGGEYTMHTVVWDAARRELISRKKSRRRTGESAVVVDQFQAGKLYTGTYTLGFAILDSTDRILTATTKKFFVYNPVLGVDSTLTTAARQTPLQVYASMSEGELDREFAHARYEAQDEENRQYAALSGVESKGAFLIDFWRKRPPGLREEYMARVNFANAHFRVLGKDGYKTDRGRVYIIYGPASDYDRHPNEPETRPYEVWTYEGLQGGVIFAFVQRVANAEYELVHSTYRNEVHDDQWFVKYAQSAY